jgi:small-conductance mechanosensitive channel
MHQVLDQVFLNNSIREYLIAASIIIVGLFALWLIRKIVLKRIRKWAESTESTEDDLIVDGVSNFGLPIAQWVIFYWGINFLHLSEQLEKIARISLSVIITYYVLRLVSSIIMLLLQARIRKQERGEEKIKQLGGLILLINLFIWIIGIVFLFDNLGYNVTTIIAGLGIGGIAIALAAQNILGDLFNYFVIYFDRPFEVGDFIIFDDKLGTVEYLGIKTTRIRCLSGEQLIVGNSNLTSARIHNYKRMFRRRILFSIDVEYGTPLEKLKQISSLLKSIVLEQEMTTFDRAHFMTYKEWSLRFDVVYFVESPEYNKYADIQQAINLRIYEEFEKHKISFAFPSQTLFVKQENINEDGRSNIQVTQ